MEHQVTQLSESLYDGLCIYVGTPTQVQIRRQVDETHEKILQKLSDHRTWMCMKSGSKREGLRMQGSDVDFMLWWTGSKVISDWNQSEFYKTQKKSLILMESIDKQPGFALLRLLTYSYNSFLLGACFRINDRYYISSSMYREGTLDLFKSASYLHGPCASGKWGPHDYEFDYAICLSSDFWPPFASSWIGRCQRKQWPSSDVLFDIINSGCHFVPIGSKNSDFEQHEWRISFSIAELKLISAMNHTQLLCYALLKVFLKEVINIYTTGNLLCSYFLKTVLFWEIQEIGTSVWSPTNLLIRFWNCFKHLIQWVYKGNCPNFFLPCNNMFRGKIVGQTQKQFFSDLFKLYSMGLKCLLLSTTVQSYLAAISLRPMVIFNTDSELINDIELYQCIAVSHLPLYSMDEFLTILGPLEQLCLSTQTKYRSFTYQRYLLKFLQNAAFYLFPISNGSAEGITRRHIYIRDKTSLNMLRLATRFGDVSSMLYLAMYYYKTARFSKALHCVVKTKAKLSQPFVLEEGSRNYYRYAEAVRGLPMSKKIKEWAFVVLLDKNFNVSMMDILDLEVSETTYQLRIPFNIMISMLTILCNSGKPRTIDGSLRYMHCFLLNDRSYKYHQCKDISWQILGICYQIAGQLQEALNAFNQSLREHPYHGIQKASHIRIQSVKCEIDEENRLNALHYTNIF